MFLILLPQVNEGALVAGYKRKCNGRRTNHGTVGYARQCARYSHLSAVIGSTLVARRAGR